MRRTTTLCVVAAVGGAVATGTSWAYPPGSHGTALQLRLGAFLPQGGGELWDTNEDVFTLDVSDLDGPMLGLGLVHSMSNRWELGATIDFYGADTLAEYRDFVDEDGFPILHDTELSLVPLTFDVRFLPFGRYRIRGPEGRRVSKPVLFLGAGGGASFWQYEETGDFLDFSVDPPEIFRARFEASDAALEVHALAGIELPLSRSVNLLFEGRWSDADDELKDDFGGLGKIELGGVSVHGGVSLRF
jgi:hypothetical protein